MEKCKEFYFPIKTVRNCLKINDCFIYYCYVIYLIFDNQQICHYFVSLVHKAFHLNKKYNLYLSEIV